MDFTLTDEQTEIAGLAERIFADRADTDRVTAIEATPDRFDRELWTTLGESGLLGLAIPEEYGGGGLGLIELCLLLEQQGRRVAPVPLHPTVVAGALPIARFGSEEQKARWLPGVTTGEVILTAALAEPSGHDPLRPTTTATRAGDGWRLDGTRMCVPAAHLAQRIVVPVTSDDGAVLVFLVDPAADGVALERAETTDREIQPHVHLSGVAVGSADLLGGEADGADVLEWIYARALVGLAALQIGVAEEAVRIAASYTSERKQFGRPLATFQGAALRAADGYIDTEALRVVTWQAAWRLETGRDAAREVAAAKFFAAESGHRVVHTTQHLHGGMGADVDYPIHRYFLWGKQIEAELGGATVQVARLGRMLAASLPG